MRSNITFFLMFILSFLILHDTVLSLADKKSQTYTIIEAEHPTSLTKTDLAISEVHSMLHIVAIVPYYTTIGFELKKSQKIRSPKLRKTFLYSETMIKPPIA